MLSFRKFLAEATQPFRGFSNIEVQSLDDFVSTSGLQEAEGDFGLDAPTQQPETGEMRSWLQRIFDRTLSKADRVLKPYLHRSLLTQFQVPANQQMYLMKPDSEIVYDMTHNTTIDAEAIKKLIKQRPETILSENEKMAKSGGGFQQFFNFGIPALRGLVVNERTNEFVIVNTCPGAGDCVKYCYARKGSYVQFKDASQKQNRVLNFLLNDPDGFFKQIAKEIAEAERIVARRSKANNMNIQLVIRWHDAGDFFSDDYKRRFFKLVRQFPKVLFYAYTKLASVSQSPDAPENFVVNFSQGAKPEQMKMVDPTKEKHSSVVPKIMFDDLTDRVKRYDVAKKKEVSSLKFPTPEALQEFKKRLAEKFMLDPKTILTHDEMMKTPTQNSLYWNVIVMPGEGDESATRRDVLGTYLLWH